jgi:hypothetical protein
MFLMINIPDSSYNIKTPFKLDVLHVTEAPHSVLTSPHEATVSASVLRPAERSPIHLSTVRPFVHSILKSDSLTNLQPSDLTLNLVGDLLGTLALAQAGDLLSTPAPKLAE